MKLALHVGEQALRVAAAVAVLALAAWMGAAQNAGTRTAQRPGAVLEW